MRIGIDVGGTNTDAVLLDGNEVVAKMKTPTTPDVTGGVLAVLRPLLAQLPSGADLTGIMIGTTHFTNAVVERRRLARTAIIRLGLPATQSLPPFVDWPEDVRKVVEGYATLAPGGREYDGRPITPFDDEKIRAIAREIGDRGIRSVAISGVFSPVSPEDEQRAAAIVGEEIPDAFISESNDIGRLGLLERENAAIVNAALHDLARHTISSFREAASSLGVDVPIYLTQNDGTLMTADFAERYPVLTFASGPTNSMRGAAFLSGLTDAIVVDIGGTTTDVGMLVGGFPRETALEASIGGIRTNFRMPDVHSIGLGGGSIVRDDPPTIGPDSVGYELTEQALVFGGGTLTTTDIAVAWGGDKLGDPERVRDLPETLISRAMDRIGNTIDEAVDRMRLTADPVPVVIVGGGRILAQRRIAGASEVIVPPHHEVANAVGAAIAQVSGEVDRVFSLDGTGRLDAMAEAERLTIARAVEAGARESTVTIVDREDVPLAYLPSNATRIRVKAVGDLEQGT